jgi:hypothetical protein
MTKWLALLFLLVPTLALAQSTAQPVQPGSITTSGCPSGFLSCFSPYSGTNPLPVTPSGSGAVPAATTNSASTIVTGGTFQTIASASTTRKSVEFENVCLKSGNCTATTNNCYLYIAASGSGTTANSIVVPPGASYLRANGTIPSDAVSATCDGTGDHYYLSIQ